MISKDEADNIIFPLRYQHEAMLRLIIFPHAGGHLYVYNNWVKHLPSFVDVVSVEYPGRGL